MKIRAVNEDILRNPNYNILADEEKLRILVTVSGTGLDTTQTSTCYTESSNFVVETYDQSSYHLPRRLPYLTRVAPLTGMKYLNFSESLDNLIISHNFSSLSDVAIGGARISSEFKAMAYIALGNAYSTHKDSETYSEKALESYSKAFSIASQLECHNGNFLRGEIHIGFSHTFRHLNRLQKAENSIRKVHDELLGVEPGGETCAQFLQRALLHIRLHCNPLTSKSKKGLIEWYEMAAAHACYEHNPRYATRIHLWIALILKALVHLNIVLSKKEKCGMDNPCPVPEELDKAIASLRGIPKELIESTKLDYTEIKAGYYFALGEYYRFTGELEDSKRNLKSAKRQVNSGEAGFFWVEDIDMRLAKLANVQYHSDSESALDDILEEYTDDNTSCN